MEAKKKRKARPRGHASASHPANLRAVQMQIAALQYREQNMPYREIAEAVGYNSPEAAQMAVLNLIRRTKSDGVAEYREIITGRLERQARNVLPFTQPKTLGGRLAINLDAVKEYRMLQAELAKLHGCYVDVTIHTGPTIHGDVNVQNNMSLKFDPSKMDDQQLERFREFLALGRAPEAAPVVATPAVVVVPGIRHDGNGTSGAPHAGGNGATPEGPRPVS